MKVKQFLTFRSVAGSVGLAALLILAGCSGLKLHGVDYSYQRNSLLMGKTTFAALPSTQNEDWAGTLKAFRQSCSVMGQWPLWQQVCGAAVVADESEARRFFEENFDVWRVASHDKTIRDTGLMTGYYEPMLYGSRTKSGVFKHPVFAVPDDLIEVDLTKLHPQLKGLRLRGKVVGRKLIPYDTRAGIMSRDNLDQYVICWVNDPVEAAFLQIQGSGRVQLPDGTFLRVGYADQNGHPYRSLGNWLIKNAGLKVEEMSMQRIKAWARDNPKKVNQLLNSNPCFVFFEEKTGYSDDDGPIGAQTVPLTPQASVAVDRRVWELGVPFVVAADQDNPSMHWAKPVVAQDTGGAIRGVLRFDFFWGYGPQAGASAGKQKSVAQAWALIPRGHHPSELRAAGTGK